MLLRSGTSGFVQLASETLGDLLSNSREWGTLASLTFANQIRENHENSSMDSERPIIVRTTFGSRVGGVGSCESHGSRQRSQ